VRARENVRDDLKFIPSVVSSKFFVPWLISVMPTLIPFSKKNALTDHVPWITFEARKWLIDYLKADMSVFEYGSGGSTIFISKRVKELISVEHDKDWYLLVSNEIVKEDITNCRLLLREPELGILNNIDYSDPEAYLSAWPGYQGMNFKRYATSIPTSIQQFPDKSFDLVFIDGRARPSCIANALAKVRPGGYIMLDNSDRQRYLPAINLLRKWSNKRFYGVGPYLPHFLETAVWRKPN